jgi:hypothetical protein
LAAKSLFTLSTNGKLVLNFKWLDDSDSGVRTRNRLISALRREGWQLPDDCEERYVTVAVEKWTSRTAELVDILAEVVRGATQV